MSENHPQKKQGNETPSKAKAEEEILEKIDPEILKGVPKNKRAEIASLIYSVQRTHSGPLPSPDYLEEYSRLIPNGAERIMQMAEKQSAHRMAMERKALASHVNQGYIGQVFGLIIGLSTIAAGVYLGLNDQPTLAAVIAGAGITGLVTAFIKGRDIEREEVDAKPKKSK